MEFKRRRLSLKLKRGRIFQESFPKKTKIEKISPRKKRKTRSRKWKLDLRNLQNKN